MRNAITLNLENLRAALFAQAAADTGSAVYGYLHFIFPPPYLSFLDP